MLIFIVGPSACGKGTQANLLADRYKIPHLSVGELLRKEIDQQTDLGKLIAPIISAGRFVPGTATEKVLHTALEEAYEKYNGAIVDGFPRLYEQAIEIQPVVDLHTGWFRIIHYTLTFEECIRRQKIREKNGGKRSDDNVLIQRLKSYEEDIEKIKSYYMPRGVYIEISADGSIEEVFEDTCKRLDLSLQKYAT